MSHIKRIGVNVPLFNLYLNLCNYLAKMKPKSQIFIKTLITEYEQQSSIKQESHIVGGNSKFMIVSRSLLTNIQSGKGDRSVAV